LGLLLDVLDLGVFGLEQGEPIRRDGPDPVADSLLTDADVEADLGRALDERDALEHGERALVVLGDLEGQAAPELFARLGERLFARLLRLGPRGGDARQREAERDEQSGPLHRHAPLESVTSSTFQPLMIQAR
jgi:hypothetical protein